MTNIHIHQNRDLDMDEHTVCIEKDSSKVFALPLEDLDKLWRKVQTYVLEQKKAKAIKDGLWHGVLK